MSANCSHEQCEPYNSCTAADFAERRDDFWWRRRRGPPSEQLGTDPLAWIDGDVPDAEWTARARDAWEPADE